MPAIIALASVSHAASCPRDRRSAAGVREVERHWVAALEQRDVVTLDCILDPAFADTSWRGELVPKTEVLKWASTRPPPVLDVSQMSVSLVGRVAIVRGLNTQSNGGQATGSVRFVDVLVYRAHRWRAISAQESLIRPR